MTTISAKGTFKPMTSLTPLRILAISGSLRAHSINTAVLLTVQALAPAGLNVTLFRSLGDLPHFNPDLDTAVPPAAVVALREAIDSVGALLICTPEYAHGIPGTLKNALDWLVSHPPFLHKPVAIINARPGADYAQASLRETLGAMNARLIDEASVTLPLTSNTLTADALLRIPAVCERLQFCLTAIRQAVPRPLVR